MATGNAVIGALRVVIGADSAALTKDLDKARGDVEKFGANMAKGAAVAAAGFAAAMGAVAIGIKNTLKEMDGFAKQSQKIGIPVEELSKLKLAADLSDVSMQQLGTGIGRLSKAMTEAAAKPTSEAANAFKALGVSVTDSHGRLRPTIDVVADIAGKFEGLKDGAAKTAVSMALFGKAGAELIPLLNSGKDGLQGMMQEAEQLGIVISTRTAKAAEAFNDNLTRLNAAKHGLFVTLTAELAPALEVLTNRLVESAKEGGSARSWVGQLGQSFVFLVEKIDIATTLMGQFKSVWVAFVDALKKPWGTEDRWAEFNKALLDAALAAQRASAAYEPLTMEINETVKASLDYIRVVGTMMNAAQEKQILSALAGKTALDQYIDSTRKSIAAQTAEMQAVGLAAGAKERLKTVLQALQVVEQKKIPITDALRVKITETANAAGDAALKLEGMQLRFANLTPLQQYQIEMANVTAAMVAAKATGEELARAQEKVAEKFGVTWQQIGSSLATAGGAMSQLTGIFAKENKAMGIASKAFGIAQVAINTAIAISKANTLLPPANFAAMAAAAAVGVAQTAAIVAQSFQTGGSFRVPGGMGGGDKVFAPLMLEPGEQVDVWRPGQGGRDPRGGAGNSTTVHIDPGPVPREWVEKIIVGINDALGDGHRLRLA